mgnify:CR=1 FL=1
MDKTESYTCTLCGRNKFQKPTPHYCGKQYIKHYNRHARKLGLDPAEIWVKNIKEE